MPYRTSLLALIPILLWACKPQKTSNLPAPVDSAEIVAHAAADISVSDSVRYIQLLRSEDSATYYTQDDCRCVQSTARFGSLKELTFSVCDSVYPGSRYSIHNRVEDSTGTTLFATHLDTADTITIHRLTSNPVIYEIRRSNYSEIEAGNLFIDAKDSAKFEHRSWDCDEYQG